MYRNCRQLFVSLLVVTFCVVYFVVKFSTVIFRESDLLDGGSGTHPETFVVSSDGEEPCTFALFREYFRLNGHFPGEGQWHLDVEKPYFQPKVCKYRHARMTGEAMERCARLMVARNSTFVMTSGDSNGHYFHQRFVLAIRKALQCRQSQGVKPCRTFWNRTTQTLLSGLSTAETSELWDTVMQKHFADCRKEHLCNVGKTDAIQLMRVLMFCVIGDTPSSENIVLYPHRELVYNHLIEQSWAMTKQEFLFKHFLADRYPDIYIVLFPFNHEKSRPSARLKMNIELFHSLARFYLPQTTKIIYVPAFSEFESKRTEIAAEYVNKTYEGLLAADMVRKLNDMVNSLLEKDLLDPERNTFGFLDLLEISKSREEWSIDGIHMEPVWYESVSSMIWETLCNSLELDAF